jgi:CDP-archaeol synthase
MSAVFTGSYEMSALDGMDCAAFLLTSFTLVGFLHTAWLKSSWSERLSAPLDFGKTFRGRRIFGDNKMLRGLVMIIPGGGVSFLLLSALLFRPWPLSALQYAGLGTCAGLGFMLGELPNSFIKRQLDIAPGGAPSGKLAKWICFVVDHTDSILGMLIAIQLIVPVPALTWLTVLGAGVFIHLSFSVAMFRLHIKARPV